MLGFSHFYRLNTLILGQFPCFSGIFHIKPFDRPIFLNYPENLQQVYNFFASALRSTGKSRRNRECAAPAAWMDHLRCPVLVCSTMSSMTSRLTAPWT